MEGGEISEGDADEGRREEDGLMQIRALFIPLCEE
jgi:hypothetical protein